MPLELRWFRDADQLAKIRESERRRFNTDTGLVDRIVDNDALWRQAQFRCEQAKKEKNALSKVIGQKKKAKENANEEMEKSKDLSEEIKALEETQNSLKASLATDLPKVGNLVHDSVVVSQDEEKDNEVIATFGETPSGDTFLPHHHLLWMIDGYEPERGVRVAGHRGYFLKGPGVMLNQALIAYALQFLSKREYTPLQPPYFMRKDMMAGVAQLSEFDESLYHVGSSGDKTDDANDAYLIATSEQPLCCYHKGEWLKENDLPIKYAGMSTCFRKEAGKHGKDTWGIFRVHQFDKIEQFCLTAPDKSWEMMEEMRTASEEYLQSLGLPYRVVNIVSGELNLAAAKKYDIECWFPGYGEFKELVSCSNCLDYQSRAMDVRFGEVADKSHVHMLNSTLCALTRTICCILENYQEKDGVRVPEVLVPFMGGTTFMPFTRSAPVTAETK